MTRAAEKPRHPARDRAQMLRDEIEQTRRAAADIADDEAVREARRDVEAAQQALREHPIVDATDHPRLTRKLANAERRHRAAMSAVAARAEQQAAELGPALQKAEQQAADEVRRAQTRVLEAARDRAAADARTVEHAAADHDHLRAGPCRVLAAGDPDLELVLEAHRGAPLGPGELVTVAVGQPGERRADDRRVITVICHERDVGSATIVLPLDRLERLPEGVRGR